MNVIPFFIMYFFVYETILNNDIPADRILFKFLSSLCFLICSLLSLKKSPQTKKYSFLVITGLFFGLIGDVFLSLIFNYAFILGAGSFAIGHILFIIAFSNLSHVHIKDFIISIFISSIFIFFIIHNKNFNLGNLLPVACIYSFIIIFMFVKACSLFKFRKINSFFTYFTILGALLFIISDFILTFEIFLNNPPEYLNAFNLITYYSGQGMIAISLSDTDLRSSKSSYNARNNQSK